MFTGLVEELGEIEAARTTFSGMELSVRAKIVLQELAMGASIAINGVCLTVKNLSMNAFQVDMVQETIKCTTFSTIKPGTKVNLERALLVGSRLGGHLVQGHVDCIGTISRLSLQSGEWILGIRLPEAYAKYVISKGSIAIDGISLTVAACAKDQFQVAIIPHTWENTNLSTLNIGATVNLEVDVIGKYVERLLNPYKEAEGLTMERLKSFGY